MLHDLGWRSLEQRRHDARLIMFYKIVYGLVAIQLPSYFERPLRITCHMYSLSYGQIHTAANFYQVSFFPMSIVLWNRLPEDVVLRVDSFKQTISSLLPINQKYCFYPVFKFNTISLFSFSCHTFSLNFHLFLLFLHRCTKIQHNTRKRVLENVKTKKKRQRCPLPTSENSTLSNSHRLFFFFFSSIGTKLGSKRWNQRYSSVHFCRFSRFMLVQIPIVPNGKHSHSEVFICRTLLDFVATLYTYKNLRSCTVVIYQTDN